MADESVILDYVIRAQDQAKGLLQQQVQLLQQLSSGITALVANQSKAVASSQASAKAANQQGDALDRLLRLQDNLNKVNQRSVNGFGALNASLQQGTKLNALQTGALRSLNTAVQTNAGFMQQHGQQWQSFIGQVKMGTPVTAQFLGQLGTLGQQFQNSVTGGGNFANSLQQINGATIAVSAAVGALATSFLHALIGALGDAVKQASLFQNTFLGLGTIAKSFGQDMEATTQAAKDLAADGLMSVRDTALTLKNLIASGFNLEQAINLAKGFKDIASFNRQASMELGYAVTSASEGIKNQNSLLVDNAGLTKNLTIILKEMGLSEQDLAKVQSDVNIRTMLYNGLLKEMGQASGDAARYTETFSGSQSKLAVNIQLLQVAIGEQLLPALTQVNNVISSVVQTLRQADSGWSSTAKFVAIAVASFLAVTAVLVTLVTTIGAVIGAIALLTPAMAVLTTALGVSTGGIWFLVAAIAGVVTAFISWRTSSKAAIDSLNTQLSALDKQRIALKEVRDQLDQLKVTSASQTDVQKGLNDAYERLKDLIPGLKTPFKDLDDAIHRVNGKLEEFNRITNKLSLNKIEQELQQFGSSAQAQGKALADTIERLAFIDREIQRSDMSTASGRDALSYLETTRQQMVDQQATIEGLITRRAELQQQTRENTKADQDATAAKAALSRTEARFGELTKGQITDAKTYAAAVEKLEKDLTILTTGTAARGPMKLEAAMRLPEIVKASKEIMSAAREGVAAVSARSKAIEDMGKAIERTRRLEQEAADHTLEYGNRVRALTRAFYDQVVGVDSVAKKEQLLGQVMARVGATFNSSTADLAPFLPLMQDIIKGVMEFGQKAPASFDAVQRAITRVDFQKALFVETGGIEASWTAIQEKLKMAGEAQIGVAATSRLLKSDLENLIARVPYGTELWKKLDEQLNKLNAGSMAAARKNLQEIAKEVSGDLNASFQSAIDFFLKYSGYISKAFEMTGDSSLISQKFLEENEKAIEALGNTVLGQTIPAFVSLVARLKEWKQQQSDAKFRTEELTAALEHQANIVKEGRQVSLDRPAQTNEFAKLGRSTAEQQIRDAQIAADAQVKAASEAVKKIDLEYNKLIHSRYWEQLTQSARDSLTAQWLEVRNFHESSVLLAKTQATIQIAEAVGANASITRSWGNTARRIQDLIRQENAAFAEGEVSKGLHIQATRIAAEEAFNEQLEKAKQLLVLLGKLNDEYENQKGALSGIGALLDSLGFGDIAAEIEVMISAMEKGHKGAFDFVMGLEAFRNGEILAGIQGVTQGLAQMIGAIKSVGEMKSGLGKILAGANLGKEIGGTIGAGIGFMLGGPMGAIIGQKLGKIGGALVGGIVAAFHKANWEKIGEDVAKRFGEPVSDELAKQIDALSKTLEGGTKAQRNVRAELLSINAILEEQGGLTSENINQFAQQSLGLFEEIARGGTTGKLALQEVNDFFGQMITHMNTNLNGFVDGAMLDWIMSVRATGVEVQALTEFLKQMADAAMEAVSLVTKGFTGRFTAAEDLTKKIDDMAQKRRDLINEMGELQEKDRKSGDKGLVGKDMEKWFKLKKELAELDKEFEKVKKQAAALTGLLSDPLANSQERFDRTGRLLEATFNAAVGSGKSFAEAIAGIGPALLEMQRAAELGGFAISDTLQHLIGLSEWATNNPDLSAGVAGLDKLMKSLANQGAVTQGVFNDFGAEAAAQFADLQNSGLNADDAMKMMQPTLQTLWELQRRFGYAVDETTQGLLNQAVEAGAVGEAHMSAQERMIVGIDKLIGRFDALLTHLGITIPAAAEAGANLVGGSLDKQRKYIDAFGGAIANAATGFTDMGTEAQQAEAAVQKQLQAAAEEAARLGLQLDTTKGKYIDCWGKGAFNASQAEGATNDVASTTGDLVGVIDSVAAAYDRMRQAAEAANAAAFQGTSTVIYGSSPGGITDLIGKLQSAVNNYYTLGSVASGVADDMVGKMLEWSKTLDDLNAELTEEGLEGLALQMFQLERQKMSMIEKFIKDMEGASQEMIDAGLATIDQLFAKRGEKAAAAERDRMEKDVEQVKRDFAVSAKLFEQTLTFMHNGMMRKVTLATPSLSSTPYSPQTLSADNFARGIPPTDAVFGYRTPSAPVSTTSAQMSQGGDVVMDFRYSNISDPVAFEQQVKTRIVPIIKTVLRQNYRGIRGVTTRNTESR